ncbi:MAG: phosphoenolpyruvate synthase, partial [Patescibacteria group bacterium]
MNNEPLILWFDQIELEHLPLVGGKNSSLGSMFQHLKPRGINLADGFAITTAAYRKFLASNNLTEKIPAILKDLNTREISDLQKRGRLVRQLILQAHIPDQLEQAVTAAYRQLGEKYQTTNTDTAVRSSATAEDLPGASFAGQQETYLNVRGEKELLVAVKKCFASLFTDRAISYRVDKGFDQTSVALSVAVQKMVRSDLGASGVAFSIDTETGFNQVVVIDGIYGLGELIVQGAVTPDEFVVFKPTLATGFSAILNKNLGVKDRKMIYGQTGTKIVKIAKVDQTKFCLSDSEIITLAKWCVEIEKYFSDKRGVYQPMDIEWAKDGQSQELFIVQARPETVQARADKNVYHEYRLKQTATQILLRGVAVGTAIASGRGRVIKNPKRISDFKAGEILVTEITDPDWEPIMKIAAAIVTDKGGRTSHAAIVSRELGIPCIVGTGQATRRLKSGQEVTVDCSSGKSGLVYAGNLPFDKITHRLDQIPPIKTRVMVNIGSPDEAFKNHYLPVAGVGLGRLEFIINSYIKIHPRALLDYPQLKNSSEKSDRQLAEKIEGLTKEHDDKRLFYINELAEGVAK